MERQPHNNVHSPSTTDIPELTGTGKATPPLTPKLRAPQPVPGPNPFTGDQSWPPEIFAELEELKQPAPPVGDSYWSQHRVHVQFVSMHEVVFVGDSRQRGRARNDLEMHLRVTSLDDNSLWQDFGVRQNELTDLIRRTAEVAGRGRIKVKEVRFQKGSIEIMLVIAVMQLGVGLIGILLMLISNRAAIKDFVQEFRTKIIPALRERVKEFFDGPSTDYA